MPIRFTLRLPAKPPPRGRGGIFGCSLKVSADHKSVQRSGASAPPPRNPLLADDRRRRPSGGWGGAQRAGRLAAGPIPHPPAPTKHIFDKKELPMQELTCYFQPFIHKII